MKPTYLFTAILILTAGCATSKTEGLSIKVLETTNLAQPHEIIGPVSVSEQIAEEKEDMIQGLAGFISQDGRVSDQIPKDMQLALKAKREKYKDMLYKKLAKKAKDEGADSVIGAEYHYVPPYATFSPKATILASGTMVQFTGRSSES